MRLPGCSYRELQSLDREELLKGLHRRRGIAGAETMTDGEDAG